jgi:NAD(P)-dependent dehydrogenase (short-subunit alcohol dehydrogenase family)
MSDDAARMTSARVALVTGASRGIGRAVAETLAASGHHVALCARDAVSLDALADVLAAAGRRVCAVALDVTDPASVATGIERIHAELGPVSVLVNNAGVASSAPIGRLTLEEWRHTFAVNVTGAFLMSQAVLPDMTDAGWGRIVNVASTAALQGFPYTAHYCASKHALLGLSRALALEVARKGVTVNCVCPGFVDTEMTARTIENIVASTGRDAARARASLESASPQHRLIQPSEVAAAVAYLVSDAARGVNGDALVING